jgi:hypothetical protein
LAYLPRRLAGEKMNQSDVFSDSLNGAPAMFAVTSPFNLSQGTIVGNRNFEVGK